MDCHGGLSLTLLYCRIDTLWCGISIFKYSFGFYGVVSSSALRCSIASLLLPFSWLDDWRVFACCVDWWVFASCVDWWVCIYGDDWWVFSFCCLTGESRLMLLMHGSKVQRKQMYSQS